MIHVEVQKRDIQSEDVRSAENLTMLWERWKFWTGFGLWILDIISKIEWERKKTSGYLSTIDDQGVF